MAKDETVLDLLGIDEASERIYHLVLRQGAASVPVVAEQLGISHTEAEDRLDTLRGMGLVARRATEDGDYAPVDPRFALRILTDRHSDGLARIRDHIGVLADQFDAGRSSQADAPQTQVLSGADALAAWYVRLQHQAGREFLAFDRPPYVSASSNPLEPVVLDRGVSWRAIYSAASFEHEGSWEEVQRLVARGEQARATQELPLKLAIADRTVAMVSLTLEGERFDALVTESPPLVEALCQLFEFYWRSAIPVGETAGTLARDLKTPGRRVERAPTPEEHAMLTLIGAGLKDEVIARQLGMSARTLRRRSQDLMAELGAANRFQAGAEAARRGWL
ncbi:hypothetical protein I6N91_12770 [Arthrobacter sp. MSA 4-2]|uniref:helix-turn-helix domain-containing protein n=1 Tax=Arthrobacter sp. MSA 4-2 TaxID=2794349 RepID=UPI0018E79E09|nr:helix-turn-helix domain-containing protein [Arthrobacter sp. MSA 4-2]MBJ2121851.1 hypothetical protein [Arthrobacter sp. MSA 4-2]